MNQRLVIAIVPLALGIASGTRGQTAPNLEIVAVASTTGLGDPDPDGEGSLGRIDDLSINDAGRVTYEGHFGGVDGRVLMLWDGAENRIIRRQGDPAPDGNGVFGSFSPQINDAGHILFSAALENSAEGLFDRSGLFIHDGETTSTLARAGDAVPNGLGFYFSFTQARMNAAGQVVAVVTILDTPGSFDGGFVALIRWTNGEPEILARVGDPSPDGIGIFGSFAPQSFTSNPRRSTAINAAGDVAALTQFRSADDDGVSLGTGVLLFDDFGVRVLTRSGAAAPDGNGVLDDFFGDAFAVPGASMSIADDGAVLVRARFALTANGDDDDWGLLRIDGESSTLLAREGSPLPGGVGTLSTLRSQIGFNSKGEVANSMIVQRDLAGGPTSLNGIFKLSPIDSPVDLVQALDGLLGSFITRFSNDRIDLNNDGRVVLQAQAQFAEGSQMAAVVARPREACQGDLDGDGQVAFSDISAVLSGWGGSGPIGDANHDGVVDKLDLWVVLMHWQAPCPSGA